MENLGMKEELEWSAVWRFASLVNIGSRSNTFRHAFQCDHTIKSVGFELLWL